MKKARRREAAETAAAAVRAGVAPPSGPPVDPRPRVLWRGPDGTIRRESDPATLARAVESGEGTLWVDIDARSPEQHALLKEVFRFHPLAIEDTLNPNSRVKCEEYQGYLFVIARAVEFDESTEDPYDLETANLCFFLGANYLVTTHIEPVASVERTMNRCSEMPEILQRGSARLLHLVLDETVDEFFPILDRIDAFVDDIEERVFVRYDDKATHDIFAVKRLVLSLKRHLSPMREVTSVLTNRPSDLLSPGVQLYFRDVYDHVLRLNDGLDTYRELLSSTMDSYLTQVSNSLSQSSKRLSIFATVSLPFVVVSGMWGMNFANIPLSHHPLGFEILLLVQLLLTVVLLAIFRWRRLI